jgi:tetrahydromethanopterin S-methyltransferase subunit E
MFDGILKSTNGALDKAKLMFSPTATTATTDNDTESQSSSQQQPDRLEELAEYCPQLTFQQRLIGFAVSFSLGCKWCFVIGYADIL